VQPYIKNTEIWYCPEDASRMTMPNGFPRPGYSLSGNIGGASWKAGAALQFIVAPAATVALGPMQSTYDSPRLMAGGDWNYAISHNQYNLCWTRHNQGENWGFCDGHAKWMKIETIYLGSCALGTSIPAGYQACFDTNCG
jgi:prepilin-type processing-associated H-X9-DG protein